MQASAVEVFQLADEGALISGTAAVLFACTLVVSNFRCRCFPISAIQATYSCMQKFLSEHRIRIVNFSCFALQGLAIGFVLLRVEALVEEGKI